MIDDLDVATACPPARVDVPRRAGGLEWAIGALVLGTVVAVDPAGLVPTGPMRWTVITLTTCVALGALVWRGVVVPRAMTRLWIALLGVLLVATIAAVDPLSAWIGTPDRRLGLLTWITFPALFLAGRACTEASASRVVLRASALGGIVLGVWSSAELLGHPPLGLHFADTRAGGPFGQPAYLGAACLLLGPLTAASALDRGESPWWRRVGACGAAGALFALAASQTRAAWVGAAIAMIAIAVQRGELRHSRRAKVIAAAVALVAIAIGVASPLGARAVSTFDVEHGTSASRFDEWRIALRTIADHPLAGVGPEGYRVVFPQEVDAAYVKAYGVAVYPDRAHNGILDVTVAGGVFAGLLYAALLALALRHAWRGLRTRDPATVALGAAVIAYVVQQQFLFPLSELDPLLWVLVGMLVARTPGPVRDPTVRARWLVAPIVVVATVAAAFGARDVLADRAMKRAATTTDLRTAERDADDATRLRPDSIRAWYVAASVAERGAALTDVDTALDQVQQGLDRSPGDPALRVLSGELLAERAVRSGLPDDITAARRELARLLADAPHDPRLQKALVTVDSLPKIGKP